MKKKKIPTFDELKNDAYEYRYSRAERLASRRVQLEEEAPVKLTERIFGKNKSFRQMLFFYVAVAVVMWVAFYAYEASGSMTERRIFQFGDKRKADVRLITGENRYGLNIAFDNGGKEVWIISNMTLELSNWSMTTDFNLTLQPEMFDAYFISLPSDVSNISKLKLLLE